MIGFCRHTKLYRMVAIVFTVATIAVSCKNKIAQTDFIDLESSPTQVVDNMVVVQTKDGPVAQLADRVQDAGTCAPEVRQ